MSKKIVMGKSHPPLVPHWMVTFSDMRVVLLCFFVLLAGFSGTGKGTYGKGPGLLGGGAGVAGTSLIDNDSVIAHPDTAGGRVQMSGYETLSGDQTGNLNTVYQGLDVRVRASVLSNALQYKLTEKGFEIEVLCGTLFEDNSAELKGGAEDNRILNVIADACRSLPHQVRVQAYADDLFVPDENFGNEESLALKRASVVCNFLHAKARLPMEQLSVATTVLPHAAAWTPDRRSQVTITVLPISRKNAL
ncbi:MAG: flagellar motor protein MotB [Candidatus Brocadiia bacterium]|jgi:flagellar motor protein MotB